MVPEIGSGRLLNDGPVASSFYRSRPDGTFDALPTTGSPWGPDSQHGGPPAALLTRALEALPEAAGRVLGRVTLELLGPVPLGPLSVSAQVERAGRSVALVSATLVDVARDRPVARATGWLFPELETGAGEVGPPPSAGPSEGVPHDRPQGWHGGYLDAVEWRWLRGAVGEPGPALVWMHPRPLLVDDEPWTPATLVMACVDSASGASSVLDPASWAFQNTELTVHLLRPPVGEWLCLDARTTLGPGSVGLATSDVYDEQGLVARSAQALLVARRR